MSSSSASGEDLLSELGESRERFLRFLQSRVHDPEVAEDLLQQSFLKALEAAPRMREQDRLVPWFYTILRNASTDFFRRSGGRETDSSFDLDTVPATEEEIRAVCDCFTALLPTLKPEYEDLIRSLDLGTESSEEARSRLGLTMTNLKVRHHRARQALRKRLEETCRVCAEHHCLDCSCRTDL